MARKKTAAAAAILSNFEVLAGEARKLHLLRGIIILCRRGLKGHARFSPRAARWRKLSPSAKEAIKGAVWQVIEPPGVRLP